MLMDVWREPGTPGEREGGANVGVAARGGQAGLWRPVTDAPQDAPDRKPDLAREVVSLVETALKRAHRMQRDGNHRIRARQEIGARVAQQRAQRTCQYAASVVLECMDDPPQRAVVAAGAASERHSRRRSAAARAVGTDRSPVAK